MRLLILYSTIFLLFSSCFEPDEVLPAVANDIVEIEIDLLQNQASFLDLHNITTTNNSEFKDWQLKFQNDAKSWSIYLNTLSQVAVHNTRITSFDSINEDYEISTINWQLDIPTNSGSYPGIGTWGDYTFSAPQSYKNVYLIQWQKDFVTQIYKLQILDARQGAYHIRYGTLDGSYVNSVWIEKNADKQHTYYSLALDKVLPNVEPSKHKWNICLTYLSDSISTHPKLPYTPTANQSFGIFPATLINQATSSVYIDTTRTLEELTFFNSADLNFRPIDELYNTFSTWDKDKHEIVLNDKVVLIVKDEDNLFAIKPRTLSSTSENSLFVRLEIKKL